MSTATKEKTEQQAPTTEQVEQTEKTGVIKYVPFGGKQEIKLTRGIVRKYWGSPTKNGVHPTDQDCDIFLMTCYARGLNPWIGDAYLIGYDAADGAKFTTITAIQALYKRAELSGVFNGIESGVIYKRGGDTADAEPVYGSGDFVPPGATLLGGWARVFRTDIDTPFFEAIGLNRAKSTSIWKSDTNGMICKVAEAGALRRAFPTECGGLYAREEIVDDGAIETTARRVESQPSRRIEANATNIADALRKPTEAREPVPIERPQAPAQPAALSPEIFALMDQIEAADNPEKLELVSATARGLVKDEAMSIEQYEEILRQVEERHAAMTAQK